MSASSPWAIPSDFDWDAVLAQTARRTAEVLERRPGKEYVYERDFRSVLVDALARLVAPVEVAKEVRFTIPGWAGDLRGVDVVARHEGALRAVAELKIHSIDQTLWDIYKLVALVGARVPAYVGIVVKSPRLDMNLDCVEFFDDRVRRHDTRDAFHRNEKAWRDLCKGGTARPIELPAQNRDPTRRQRTASARATARSTDRRRSQRRLRRAGSLRRRLASGALTGGRPTFSEGSCNRREVVGGTANGSRCGALVGLAGWERRGMSRIDVNDRGQVTATLRRPRNDRSNARHA
jgi:hypothetical protein